MLKMSHRTSKLFLRVYSRYTEHAPCHTRCIHSGNQGHAHISPAASEAQHVGLGVVLAFLSCKPAISRQTPPSLPQATVTKGHKVGGSNHRNFLSHNCRVEVQNQGLIPSRGSEGKLVACLSSRFWRLLGILWLLDASPDPRLRAHMASSLCMHLCSNSPVLEHWPCWSKDPPFCSMASFKLIASSTTPCPHKVTFRGTEVRTSAHEFGVTIQPLTKS